MIKKHLMPHGSIVVVVDPATQQRKEYTWDEYVQQCINARNWQRALENAIEVPGGKTNAE